MASRAFRYAIFRRRLPASSRAGFVSQQQRMAHAGHGHAASPPAIFKNSSFILLIWLVSDVISLQVDYYFKGIISAA